MKSAKQKKPWRLLHQQLRFAEGGLASAFIEMVGALPCRPEPRHIWDNVASPLRAVVKGFDAVLAGWIAMTAAVDTGSDAVIQETAHRVEQFFDAMKAVALAPYYAYSRGETTTREKKVHASKEMTEALHAIYADEDLRTQIREIDESIAAELDLRADLVAILHEPAINRRAQMAIL